MAWHVDEGLAVFIRQMKAAYPGITIGTIGDASHSSRTSDHNPDPDGSVDAADPMVNNRFFTADADEVVKALVKSRDERIAYIIWQRRIISSRPVDGYQAWTWRHYDGSDPHVGHFHMSVNDKHHSNRDLWSITLKEDDVLSADDKVWLKATIEAAVDRRIGDVIPRVGPDGERVPATDKNPTMGHDSAMFYLARDIYDIKDLLKKDTSA
jgi:hypothetical protein